MGPIETVSIVMFQDMDQPLVFVIKCQAMTNVSCRSSSTGESQWQVSAGAAGVQMIQRSSNQRIHLAVFHHSGKKY